MTVRPPDGGCPDSVRPSVPPSVRPEARLHDICENNHNAHARRSSFPTHWFPAGGAADAAVFGRNAAILSKIAASRFARRSSVPALSSLPRLLLRPLLEATDAVMAFI